MPPNTASFRIGVPDGVPSPYPPLTTAALSAGLVRGREMAQLTQAQFGQFMDVDRVTILRAEKGHTSITPEFLQRAAEVIANARLGNLVGIYAAARDVIDGRAAERDPKAPPPPTRTELADQVITWYDDQVSLISTILMFGGAVVAKGDTWKLTFDFPRRMLDGVPVAYEADGDRWYWGYDIGGVLEAAIRGKAYSEWTEGHDRAMIGAQSEARLVREAEFRYQGTEAYLLMGPLTTAERNLREFAKYYLASKKPANPEPTTTPTPDAPSSRSRRSKTSKRGKT